MGRSSAAPLRRKERPKTQVENQTWGTRPDGKTPFRRMAFPGKRSAVKAAALRSSPRSPGQAGVTAPRGIQRRETQDPGRKSNLGHPAEKKTQEPTRRTGVWGTRPDGKTPFRRMAFPGKRSAVKAAASRRTPK